MRCAVHNPHEIAVGIVGLCRAQRRDQRTEERNALRAEEVELYDIACVQIGKCPLLGAPPGRLAIRGKAIDKADRLVVAVAVNARLIHSKADCLAEIVDDGGEQLKVVVVLQRGVRHDHKAADHVAVQLDLGEVDVQLVKSAQRLRPNRLGDLARDILAGRALERGNVQILVQLAVALRRVAQHRQQRVRDAEIGALDVALFVLHLAHARQKRLDVVALHLCAQVADSNTADLLTGFSGHFHRSSLIHAALAATGLIALVSAVYSILHGAFQFVDLVGQILRSLFRGVQRFLDVLLFFLKGRNGFLDRRFLLVGGSSLNVGRELVLALLKSGLLLTQFLDLRVLLVQLLAQKQNFQCHNQCASSLFFIFSRQTCVSRCLMVSSCCRLALTLVAS